MIWWQYLKTQLSILQLENYEVMRWWHWWKKNPFVHYTHFRKPLVWTNRVYLTVLCGLIFIVFPPLGVGFGALIVELIDKIHRRYLKYCIHEYLSKNPSLTRVAITGSYGKTSVKSMLYTILDHCSYALTTPGSFNTFGGIVRVLKHELTKKHAFFVVELGAFKPGDIGEMAQCIKPHFGILTAIGPQHLERFGSQEAITQTKFELLNAVHGKKVLVNWDNELIKRYIIDRQLQDRVISLSFTDTHADYYVDQIVLKSTGIKLVVHSHGRMVSFMVPHLFGTVMALNVSLAIVTALELGISADAIQKSLHLIHSPNHRLEVFRLGNAQVIDNTYSSNVDGFKSVLDDLFKLRGSKSLVTPGIVELGNTEYETHVTLGEKMAPLFDHVVLLGENKRTKGIEAGLVKGSFTGTIEYIAVDTTVYWKTVNALSKKYQWILLENDVSEHYL